MERGNHVACVVDLLRVDEGETQMTKDEALKKAFKQAFQLGQEYWYQADHEFVSQNKKSDVTRAKFEQLMEDAIKEALAQPEQEPVAFEKTVCPFCTSEWVTAEQHDRNVDRVERKPLTDEEIMNIAKVSCIGISPQEDTLNFAKVIEAVHGIKGEA